MRIRMLAALLALVVPALAPLATGSPGAAATPDRPGVLPARAATAVRTVTVAWDGSDRRRRMTRSVTVPGIGQLKAICRPDDTMLQLTADQHGAETQMWLAKHETKAGEDVVAVKTVRLYAYANAADTTPGGPYRGHEGLNQRSPIEDTQSGYADGLISQRPGRTRPALAASLGSSLGSSLAPATSFELTWWWSGFRQPRAQQSCRMQLTLRTAAASYGLSWHGDADAASGPDTRSVAIRGVGTLTTTCETGRDSEQDIALSPVAASGWSGAYVETISGEGLEEDHVDSDDYDLDPVTGLIGPIPLPVNGMLRIFFTVGSATWDVIVSSYVVDNDDVDPRLDLCEIAAAPF